MGRALVIIDMQCWMFSKDRKKQLPAVSKNIAKLIGEFDRFDLPIFDIRVEHKADKSTWSRAMLDQDCAVMIEGTADVEPVDGYMPPARGRLIKKPANSAFINCNFKKEIEKLDIRKLVICGAFIDGCVGLTAADAEQYGYEVTLVDDAIAHARIEHRSFMFEWLTSMYGLKRVNTEDLT